MNDSIRARELLAAGGYTCVLVSGGREYHSTERGIRPLMQWLEGGTDCRGFSAADKVVGKATAFLYVLLGVREVHAGTMSRSAAAVLERYGVPFTRDREVEAILNRTQDGFCPMESAVRDVEEPQQAYRVLLETCRKMQK